MWGDFRHLGSPSNGTLTDPDKEFFGEFLSDKMKEKDEPNQPSTDEVDDWEVDGWELDTSSEYQCNGSQTIKENGNDKRKAESHRKRVNSLAATPRATTAEYTHFTTLVEEISAELKQYLFDFADPQATEELNEDLSLKKFPALYSYYAARPELAEFTVNTEIDRLSYTVKGIPESWWSDGRGGCSVKGDGQRGGPVTEPDQVRAVLRDLVLDEGSDDLYHGTPKPLHLLVRMANQSIVADMIEALDQYLIRPSLLTSCVVGDMDLVLDLTLRSLHVAADVVVSTVASNHEPPLRRASSEGSNQSAASTASNARCSSDRLELGTLRATVAICVECPMGKAEFRFQRPSLRMILDGDLRRAAAAIAEHRIEVESQ